MRQTQLTFRTGLARVAVVVIVLSCLAAGCDPKTPTNHLVVGVAGDVGTLDPAAAVNGAASAVGYWCYERLVDFVGGGATVQAALARTWSVSDDGLVWDFVLREDARFEDGRPVDAPAVKFTFDRLVSIAKEPTDAFPTLLSTTAAGPFAVRFTLSEPFPPLLSALANYGASIVNPGVMDHEVDGDMGQAWLAGHTMGSGPYKLAEFAKGNHCILVAHAGFPGGPPKLATVTVKLAMDPVDLRLQLEQGRIDAAAGLPPEAIAQLRNNTRVTVESWPGLAVTYVAINCQRAPLSRARLRQALCYATDYAGIISGPLGGQAVQMRGPVPEGLWGHDPEAIQHGYDPDRAGQLLAASGVETPATLLCIYSDADAKWESIARSLGATFGGLGITVQLEKLDPGAMRERLDGGKYDLAVLDWRPAIADPYLFMHYWFESDNWGLPGNRAFYKNDQVDVILARARGTHDQFARGEQYATARRLIAEDAPYILLAQNTHCLALRSCVEGFVPNPLFPDVINFYQLSKQ